MKGTFHKFILNLLIFCFTIANLNTIAFATAKNFTYSSVTPANNNYLSSTITSITFNFSNSIDIYDQSLYDMIAVCDNKGNSISIDKSITDKILSINLIDTLAPNTKYTVSIPGGALTYLTDRSYINSPITTYFTTRNYTFDYSSSIPRNNESNVAINQQYVSLSFSDNIAEYAPGLTDSITVEDSSGRSVSDKPIITNNLLQFKITETLQAYTTYKVFIPQGTLKYVDSSDDKIEINEDLSISFTTENDVTRPKYLPNQTTGIIQPGESISIKFDQKIRLSKDQDKIRITQQSNGMEIPVKSSVSQSGYDLVVTPLQTLQSKQSYKLFVPMEAVTDLHMNTMYYDFSMRLTTGTDLSSPEVVSSSITDGQKDVPIGTYEITIHFNERIKYAEAFNGITLQDGSGKQLSIQRTISDDILTISLPMSLAPATDYSLSIPAQSVQDYDENAFSDEYIISFTTNNPGSNAVAISSCAVLNSIDVDAGTSYDDVIDYILPKEVMVILSDKAKTNAQVGVEWSTVTPEYNENLAGIYTFTGKLVVRDNIQNTKKIKAAAKIRVVDRIPPIWQIKSHLDIVDETSNSIEMEWMEATDDTYISEYLIDLVDENSKTKTIKIASDKVTRLSSDKNDSDYSILKYTLTGLQPGSYYTLYLTAIDSQGNATSTQLSAKVWTDEKVTSSTSVSKPKPTARPVTTPKPGSSSSSINFKDLSGYDWAESAINSLAKRGVIHGTSKDMFSPGDNITRADLVVLIVSAFDLEGESSDNFSDVPKSAYYYDKVGIAKKLDIIKGDETNNFRPNDYITREDMFAILKRAIDISDTQLLFTSKSAKSYADYNAVSDYAKDAVENLVSAEIITGDNNKINPKNYASRAEVAVILNKF